MKLKILALIIVGILSYVLLLLAVMFFYKDDSEQMTWQDREAFNAKIIHKLDISRQLTQDEITSRLGVPDITAATHKEDAVYQLLYYRTHRKVADGITTADECTALLFKNRQLQAIGDKAIEQYQALGVASIF